MQRPLIVLVFASLFAAALGLSLWHSPAVPRPPAPGPGQPTAQVRAPLVVYCAASNRAVMETIAEDYRLEYGVPVEFQFGPSQTLLSSIEVSGTGDLYLPADASYLETAAERGLTESRVPLARMHVVVGVKKGNPKQVHTFPDLLRSPVRVVQANPDVAAVGKLTREALTPQGEWELLKEQTDAFVSTVTEAANAVHAGAADAAIIYDAVLSSYDDLEPVLLPEFATTHASVDLGIITSSKQPALARHFVDYVSASDRGLKRYAEFGFTPVAGTPWKGAPLP